MAIEHEARMSDFYRDRRRIVKSILLAPVAIAASKGARPVEAAAAVISRFQANVESEAGAETINTRDVWGLHDAPIEGGSVDIIRAQRDWNDLKPNMLLSINPRQEILTLAKKLGITVIIRAVQPDNKYDKNKLQETLDLLNGQKDFSVQPFNEVNIEEKFIKPAEHMDDFLKAAEQIEQAGGKTILTPLSQNGDSDRDDMGYLGKMLGLLKYKKSGLDGDAWIKKNITVGVHNYFKLDDDPWTRVSEINAYVKKVLGYSLPLHILETAVHVDDIRKNKPDVVANKIVSHMNSPVPDGLTVLSNIYWLYANRRQRKRNEGTPTNVKHDQEMQEFEDYAWRKFIRTFADDQVKPIEEENNGESMTFKAIKGLNDQSAPIQVYPFSTI